MITRDHDHIWLLLNNWYTYIEQHWPLHPVCDANSVYVAIIVTAGMYKTIIYTVYSYVVMYIGMIYKINNNNYTEE